MRSTSVWKTQGIILARRDYSEADRIVDIYTKDYGKVSLLAKSVKKPKSRKRGHMEVFSKIKFSAVHTKGFDILSEVEILDPYHEIRSSLRKISVAYYIVEVANKITKESEDHQDYYNFIEHTFEKLKTNTSLKRIRLNFVYESLVLLGYWPASLEMGDPDSELAKVIERKISSSRVGKKVLS